MRMLDASDATATRMNLLNRLPTWVRSLVRTDVTILGSAEVMCFLGLCGRPVGHPDTYTHYGSRRELETGSLGSCQPTLP